MKKQYQIVNGMAFDIRTPLKVCETLSKLANSQRVLKITCGNDTLYQADNFQMYDVCINGKQVFIDNVLYADCKDENQAQRLAEFMKGTRNAK